MNEMQQKVSAIGVVPVIKLTNPTRDGGQDHRRRRQVCGHPRSGC